jgi:hypothetical protein
MTELPAADRFSDARTDNPYWNENSWFSLSIPERRMHGIIQYCFRPNMGILIGGPVLWDQSGTSQYNCLYYNWSHLQAAPAGGEKYNMKARNSLSVKVLEPMKRYKIDYNFEGFEMDLMWEAIGPHHQLQTSNAEMQEASAAFHFEQPGRMKGVIRRHGEEFKVDCWSMRDGSSGPYDAEFTISGGYFWGIGERKTFLSISLGDTRETTTIGGFLMVDGIVSDMVSGQRKVLEYGQYGPSRVTFAGVDRLGRTVKATGKIDPGLVFTAYTDHTVIWSLMQWECDGETCWGDNQEFYPAESFRRMARGEIKLGDRQ